MRVWKISGVAPDGDVDSGADGEVEGEDVVTFSGVAPDVEADGVADGEADGGVDRIDGVGLNGGAGKGGGTEDEGDKGEKLNGCFHGMGGVCG